MNAEEEQDDKKSKSQIKREMLELRDIGEEIINLGAAALEKIPLDPQLREAIDLARKINKKKKDIAGKFSSLASCFETEIHSPLKMD